MSQHASTNIKNILAWVLAIALTLFLLFTVHSLAKLPDEPLWASPALWLENWEFAIGVGLGLPYSEWTAPIILLLVLGINYLIIKRLMTFFSQILKYLKQNQTSD
jgi:uncharacterized membrane protein